MPKTLVACYVTLVLFGIAITSALYFSVEFAWPEATPSGASGVIGRVAWYREHANEYDLVILGDSRTYCGLHPFLIDPVLGVKSINLAQFAHWFPTQYPMIRDLVSAIPVGTTVMWSVGHQNFFAGSATQRVYPIRLRDVLRYLAWGVPGTGVLDNALYYNPFTHLVAARSEIRQKLVDYLDRPVALPSLNLLSVAHATESATDVMPRNCPRPIDAECVQAQWQTDDRIAEFTFVEEQGRRNSIVFYTARGSYFRVETDPAFFRGKQREMTPAPYSDEQAQAWSVPSPDVGMWRLFEAMLDEFERRGVRLVVNEMEEAPFIYAHPLLRQKYRDFMRDVVRRRVEARGFAYIRADFDRLTNEDYFDYNHLNSAGAEKYDAMVAELLAPHLVRP